MFSCQKALWLCLNCRKLFANRTLHSFLEEKNRSRTDPNADLDADSNETTVLRAKVAELTKLISDLQNQVTANHEAVLAKMEQAPPPVKWPSQSTTPVGKVAVTPSDTDKRNRAKRSVKRRRGLNGLTRPPSGTSDIDLSDLHLSCPIVATAPPPKCWVYLSGFNPKITDEDVMKIVKRCMDFEGVVEAYRLVPKDAITSRYTYVSYKVGLDLSLKEKALMLSNWPQSIKVREFVKSPKNESISPTEQSKLTSEVIVVDQQDGSTESN